MSKMEIINKYNGLFLTFSPMVWLLCFTSVYSEQDYFFYLSPLPIIIFYIAIGYHFFGRGYEEDMSFNVKNLRTTWPLFYYHYLILIYAFTITAAVFMPISVMKGLEELDRKAEWNTLISEVLIDYDVLQTTFGDSRIYTKPEWVTDSLNMERYSKIHTQGNLNYGSFNLRIDENGQLLSLDSIVVE